MATFDAVLVGSGINTLTAAALLAREGWGVCVLERSDRLGGAIRTEADYTLPGFTHEVLSSWHPLFTGSAAYAELGAELDRFASGDGAAWQSQFEDFMANADLSFGVLGTELWSAGGLGLGQKMLRRFGRHGLLEFAGHALSTCRDWTTATFRAPEAHGLLAPWVLHTGLGPDNAVSGFMTQVIACAVQLGGMPVPVGGGTRLVDALAGIVRDAGGELRTGAEVARITVSAGRATGVALADGEMVSATRAVVAGVTPTQLYGSLLRPSDIASDVRDAT